MVPHCQEDCLERLVSVAQRAPIVRRPSWSWPGVKRRSVDFEDGEEEQQLWMVGGWSLFRVFAAWAGHWAYFWKGSCDGVGRVTDTSLQMSKARLCVQQLPEMIQEDAGG